MQSDRPIAYVTDVEGVFARLEGFATNHPYVSLLDTGTPHERIEVKEGAKQRQPQQVVLIGGNRDLNKLRILRELGPALPKRAPPEAAVWSTTQRLRYIFEHTMGAAQGFEHRRTELGVERSSSSIADDQVCQSFVDDLQPPHGLLFRYLQHVQLAFRCGHTLYVHGGIDDQSLGHIPNEPTTSDLLTWMEGLNRFCTRNIEAYAQDPRAMEAPPFLAIVRYQAPVAHGRNPTSVVYGRLGSDTWNNPGLPTTSSSRWLAERGIRRVVVGHTPSGDLPVLMRDPDADVEYVIADNSRGRVDAAPMLTITDDQVHYRGACVSDDGERCHVEVCQRRDDTLSPVGLVTAGGSFVKAIDGEDALLFRFAAGFTMEQRRCPLSELGPLQAPTATPMATAIATTVDEPSRR
jgi:hypothetical protein